MLIRRGHFRDSVQFSALVVSLAKFEKLPRPSQSALNRLCDDVFVRKRLNSFVAEDGAELVGYALYYYTYSSFLAKPTLYLEDIFVLEGRRRHGVGSALFDRCVKEAAASGCGRMEWAVLNWNGKAMRFYLARGARRLDEWSAFRLEERAIRNSLKRERRPGRSGRRLTSS